MYKYSVDIFASLLNLEFTFVKTATFFFFLRITGCLKLDIKIAKCRDFPDYIFLVINDNYPPPKKKTPKNQTHNYCSSTLFIINFMKINVTL